MARIRKRKKQSGIVYFAVNNRIDGMVNIGKTIDSADKRLEYANKPNPFMCGKWSITQKVKTNGVDRTEELAHHLFEEFHDKKSVSFGQKSHSFGNDFHTDWCFAGSRVTSSVHKLLIKMSQKLITFWINF